MFDPHSVPTLVALTASVFAGVNDARSFRIPNTLTIPLLLAGPIYHGMILGLTSLVLSGLGLLMGFLLLLPLYLKGGMGAGDVKLMAGLGAWLGPTVILKVLLVSCLLAGIASLIVLARRRNAPAVLLVPGGRVEEAASDTNRRLRVIPFGLAVAIAVPFTFHLFS